MLQAQNVFIENVFTPNGDGINELFPGDSLRQRYPEMKLTVYNRWGEKVFESNPGKRFEGWDGTKEGTPLPDGTYFYEITLDGHVQKGVVTIIGSRYVDPNPGHHESKHHKNKRRKQKKRPKDIRIIDP